MATSSIQPLLRRLRRLVGPGTPGPEVDRELLRRFADERDETAFAELVERHGPLVHGVCARVLGQTQDAEDACQATFLVLARRPEAIRQRESLASYLHGVAIRVAAKARVAASIRHERERRAEPPAARVDDEPSWREMRQVLDEELQKLPAKYREPLLRCYLQCKSQEEAARELGWSAGTLRGRLDRGRDRLKQQLIRRGVSLSTALGAMLLAQSVGQATLPACVQEAARRTAAGEAISPQVQALMQEALPATRWQRGHGAVAACVLIGVTGLAGYLSFAPSQEQRDSVPGAARMDQYGDPLPEGALARLGTIRYRSGVGGGVRFLPDGKTIAQGSNDALALVDRETGKPRRFDLGSDRLQRLAFSPDGLLVAGHSMVDYRANNQSPTVRIWETTTGKLLRTFVYHDPKIGIHCLALSPKGDRIALGGMRPIIRVVDTTNGNELWKVEGEFGGGHRHVTFSPDGKLVAAHGPNDTSLCLWDATTGQLEREVCKCGYIAGIAFSANGEKLAAATKPQASAGQTRVRIWDMATNKELPVPAEQAGMAFHVALSPDGKTLAACFGSHRQQVFWGPMDVMLWDAATGKKLHQFPAGWDLAFSPDGKTLASAYGAPVQFHDVATGKELVAPYIGHESAIWSVAFTPDGKAVHMEDRHNVLRVWDPSSGKQLDRRASRKTLGNTWSHSPDGQLIAWQDQSNHTITVSELATGKVLHVITCNPKEFSLVNFAFAPDSKTIAGVSSGHPVVIALWEADTGKQLLKSALAPGAGYACVDFSADGKRLILGGRDDTVHVWDVAAQKTWAVFGDGRPVNNGEHYVWCLAQSPDGKSIAASMGRDLLIWEMATGKVRRRLKNASGRLAFSPDGMLIVSANTDALVWDATGARSVERQGAFTNQELAGLWADLGSDDAARAYRGLGLLTLAPAQSVPYLEKKVPPASFDERHVNKLLSDLESEEFSTREQATGALEQLGEQAASALRHFLANKPSLEAQRRAQDLLDKLGKQAPTGAGLRAWRAVEVLEAIGSAEARRVLDGLAKGTAGATLTVEARAARERLVKRPSE